MRVARSNLRAGIVTLAVIGAFCAVLWGWLEWRASGRIPYSVWFPKDQGVYGLAPGAPVRVGGIRRGNIVRIDPKIDGGEISGYRVHIELDREVPVTDRTRIRAESEGVSGESFLVAVNVGRRAPMTQGVSGPWVQGTLPADSEIPLVPTDAYLTWGGTASSDLMRRLWNLWVPDEGPGLWERLRATGNGMAEEGGKLSDGWTRLAANVDRDFPRWKQEFVAVRKDTEAAFERLGTSKDASPDTIVPQARQIADDLRNIPRIETERVGEAGAAFDRAIASVKALGRRSADLRAILEDAETSLGSTGADYSLASQDLAATETEAFRAPWRLIASPGDAQRRAEARQDLARLFAEAATEHQRAMKGIEDALRRDRPLLEKDPALASLLRTRLEAANALFESRLADMESLLLGPAAGAAPAPGTP